jgi:hypothetical protein
MRRFGEHRCRKLGVRPSLLEKRRGAGFRLTLVRLLKCLVPTNPMAPHGLDSLSFRVVAVNADAAA